MEAEEVASVLGPQDEVTLFETFPDTARSEKNEITGKTTADHHTPSATYELSNCWRLLESEMAFF